MFAFRMLAAACLAGIASAGFATYPMPSFYAKSGNFTVKVNGTSVAAMQMPDYDYVHLSMDQGKKTEFRITIKDKIEKWEVSPRKLKQEAKVDGKTLIFSIAYSHYMIFNINDLKQMVVLVDQPESNVPKADGPGVYNVLNYGADNTGASVTTGIQAAMDAAAKSPGSTVYVPPGVYSMGHLMLRSQTSLYVAGGAVIRFTGNKSDYKMLYDKGSIGPGTWWIQTEFESKDIRVFGRGIFDGNGSRTRANKFVAIQMVPAGTTNFKLDGVTFRESPFWTLVPTQSTNVDLANVKILNQFSETENDGVDICESSKVTVRHVVAIARDDSFSVKTWKETTDQVKPYPYTTHRPAKDIVFSDCYAWTKCYGYKIGEGVEQPHQNVTFKDSVVYKAGVGMGIHAKWGSSLVKQITYENMEIEYLKGNPAGQATWLSLWVHDVNAGAGRVENVVVKNIKAWSRGAQSGNIEGASKTANIKGVSFSNVYIQGKTTPAATLKDMNLNTVAFADNIQIKNT